MSNESLEKLVKMRSYGGEVKTPGLSDTVITEFVASHPLLAQAIDEAYAHHQRLQKDYPEDLALDEKDLVERVQEGYLNFYSPAAVNPYVALCARGPWIVTSHGAVLHDSGGYGMLGNGHGPHEVLDCMSKNWVMANIMTPSFSHKRFMTLLKKEIGHNRADGFPFDKIVCLNSGSESVTVAARICDINAKHMTDAGARHEGKTIKMMAMVGAFHGRTDRPAQISHNSLKTYRKTMATFRDRDNLITVHPGDVEGLREAFAQAEKDNVFIEALFIEPVMGEGVPGRVLEREFYDAARQLTRDHGGMLIIDSIQAGFRGTGCLSVTDYPGFEDCEAPDMETYSKALNAGQYPLSVLAMGPEASEHLVRGVYGNTMTTNPRALEVGAVVLEQMTDDVRANIKERGLEFVDKLKGLAEEFPGAITHVEGTGLLLCAEMDPEKLPVVGFDGIETYCRRHGVGVIHGGQNALRFTPHFRITSAEIDIVINVVRDGLNVLWK